MSGVADTCFMVTVCTFVGSSYTVRCPACSVVSMCPFDDGDKLRLCPMWKTCWLGHKFLVSLDDTPPFDRVAFVDGSEHPHPMESHKKKARVGPSRTEVKWDAEEVRERMGVVAPVDRRKPRPAPLQVQSFSYESSPPLHTKMLLGPKTDPGAQARCEARKTRRAPEAYDSDDEDVDVDAALQPMVAVAAESAAGMSDA